LISGIIGGAAMSARAAEAAKEARRYVFVYLEAGPSRWAYDLALNPYGNQSMQRNAGLNNAFNAAGQPIYLAAPVTAGGQTLTMPALWSGTLLRPGGAPAEPAAKLLENMLIVRGYDMLADGHASNRIKQIYPLPGAPSLNGLVAQSTSAPLPSVSLMGPLMDDAYLSPAGVGQLVWNPGDQSRNALQQFLDAFVLEATTKSNPLFESRKDANEMIEQALAKMQAATERRMPGATGLFRDRANALKLLNTALGDLNEQYTALFNKYRGIIAACATTFDIPNVNAAPVAAAALAAGHRNALINGGTFPLENGDLRQIFGADTTIINLAEGFAVAEYLLTQKYGAAVGVNANLPNPMHYVAAGGQALPNPYNTDEHVSGTAVSTLVMAFYYRSVMSCIYELSTVLKAQSLWDETVVHVAAEFSRSPRMDGTGSDHGFEANVTSIYSGAIKKPAVLGNCRVQASDLLAGQANVYGGTWGAAANVQHDKNNAHLNIGHVTSTVAALLRVEQPMKNFSSVVEVKDSGVEPVIEVARNV
jgi:hypothetical protein